MYAYRLLLFDLVAALTCRTAGVDGEPVVFLFSDTQIVQEGFLEDINNMLNSGGLGAVRYSSNWSHVLKQLASRTRATGLMFRSLMEVPMPAATVALPPDTA